MNESAETLVVRHALIVEVWCEAGNWQARVKTKHSKRWQARSNGQSMAGAITTAVDHWQQKRSAA